MADEIFTKTVGKWLDASGPNADIVISSRVRLARNLRGLCFPGRTSPAEQEQIVRRTETALEKFSFYVPERFVTSQTLDPLKTRFLVERHLVSPDFATNHELRAVFIGHDETLSLMVNEEDHLRVQLLGSGFELEPMLRDLQSLDQALGAELGFAFSQELGFLTACPTNVGTGLRASVLIHLPGLALTQELERILRGATQVGLAVRGLFGEGTETKGNLFQVSNQVTLGRSEEEIVAALTQATSDIISAERRARSFLFDKLHAEMEDKIFRADAILRNARLLASGETANLLGLLRLGVSTGLLSGPALGLINELLILTRPANLQLYFDQEMAQPERDARRSELVRARLITGG